jgi:hypothetical protein
MPVACFRHLQIAGGGGAGEEEGQRPIVMGLVALVAVQFGRGCNRVRRNIRAVPDGDTGEKMRAGSHRINAASARHVVEPFGFGLFQSQAYGIRIKAHPLACIPQVHY